MGTALRADVSLPAQDLESIEQAARDYIESWYTADAERMRNCLHPELAKRTVVYDEVGRTWSLRQTDATRLVTFTAEGRGTKTPPDSRIHEITILDTHRNIASVKVVSTPFVDYLHIARFDHRWLVVNVIWESRAG